MTERIRTIHVTLDKDYRVDDGEDILNAIRMTKGVHHAEYGDVVDHERHSARNEGRQELEDQIREVIKPSWIKQVEARRLRAEEEGR